MVVVGGYTGSNWLQELGSLVLADIEKIFVSLKPRLSIQDFDSQILE